MNCEEARQTFLEFLDGPVAAELRLLMENHIATCEACRSFAEVQQAIDARLIAAVPAAALSSAFRSSLVQKLDDPVAPGWPESLPDIAHLTGCAVAILLLLLVLPEYSRAVLLAGSGLTAVTYFVQSVLRTLVETE